MTNGRMWPVGVSVILLATVAANIALYHVAGADPSFAIEPDYYAKAVAWDSTLAQAKRNAALGWRVSPSLDAYAPRTGAKLSVMLTDSAGAPIPGATVKVAALYNARAASILAATLAPSATGYETRLPIDHAGEWELRFDVTRGS